MIAARVLPRVSPFRWLLPALILFAAMLCVPLLDGAPPANTATPTPTVAPPTKEGGVDPWNVASVIATVLATAIAAYSAYESAAAAKQSEAAARQSELATRATHLATLWSDIEALTFLSIAEMQQLNTSEVADKVRRNVNRYEKIAFHWATGLVDRSMLERELGEGAALLYEQIQTLGLITPLNRTGAQLLAENPLAPSLYAALRQRFPAHPQPLLP